MPTTSAPTNHDTIYAPSISELIRQMRRMGQLGFFMDAWRICLGNNFSLFETHVIVAMLAPRFQLRLKPGHEPQVVMEGTIASKNGMPMFIQERL